MTFFDVIFRIQHLHCHNYSMFAWFDMIDHQIQFRFLFRSNQPQPWHHHSNHPNVASYACAACLSSHRSGVYLINSNPMLNDFFFLKQSLIYCENTLHRILQSLTEFSLVTPRILNCSAISMKSIKSSLFMCTSPMYMKSKIARNTSPLTPLMKNTGCEHGFFYQCDLDCVALNHMFNKLKCINHFLLTFRISRKYGLHANSTNLCAPNCLPSHENVISTRSAAS